MSVRSAGPADRGGVRCVMWIKSRRSLIGKDDPTPPNPRRDLRCEQRALADRDGSSTCDPDTKAYRERRRADGTSDRKIIHCLKRYVARDIYRLLTNPPVVPEGATLRSERTAAKVVVNAGMSMWPLMRRHERSASSIPAAHQRRRIGPSLQSRRLLPPCRFVVSATPPGNNVTR